MNVRWEHKEGRFVGGQVGEKGDLPGDEKNIRDKVRDGDVSLILGGKGENKLPPIKIFLCR